MNIRSWGTFGWLMVTIAGTAIGVLAGKIGTLSTKTPGHPNEMGVTIATGSLIVAIIVTFVGIVGAIISRFRNNN